MEILALILSLIGLVISVVGGIWLLVVAFRTHLLWGLACLFIPFVLLIFVILHWREAARPFGVSLLGSVIALIAELMINAYAMQPPAG